MRSRARVGALVLAAVLPAAAWAPSTRPPAPTMNPRLATVPLVIREGQRVHRLTVEVARSDEQREHGLMLRTRLAPDEGMLFPLAPARPASFWMRDTLIPLDMIFIREDGSIARIAARVTPRSLAPVQVGEPVAAVLEIAGGRAAALGIDEQAHVSWPGGPQR